MILNLVKFVNKYSLLDRYTISSDSRWLYLRNKLELFHSEGWKIHISCYPNDFNMILNIIIPVIKKYSCSFKVPITEHAMMTLLYGDMPYTETGKIITIYSPKEGKLQDLVRELYLKLPKTVHENIPTDFNYRDSNIYLRYGNLLSSFCILDDKGYIVPAIYNINYKKIPDVQISGKYKPSWIKNPNFFNDKNDRSISSNEVNLISLGISNPSILSRRVNGIVCNIMFNKKPAILKLAVKGSIVDEWGRDGISQLQNELFFLTKMKSLNFIPNVLFSYGNKEIFLIVEEKVKGFSLNKLFLNETNKKTISTKNIKDIILKIAYHLRSVEGINIVLRDLNPNNIIIDSNNNVSFIDFGSSSFKNETVPFEGGTNGFFEYQLHDKRNTFRADIYALGAIIFNLTTSFIPYFKEQMSSHSKKSFNDKLCRISNAACSDSKLFNLCQIGIYIMLNPDVSIDEIIRMLKKEKMPYKRPITQKVTGGDILTNAKNYIDTSIKKLNLKNSVSITKGIFDKPVSPISLNQGLIGTLLLMNEYSQIKKNNEFLVEEEKIINWIENNYSLTIKCDNLINGEALLLFLLNKLRFSREKLKKKIIDNINKISKIDSSFYYGSSGILYAMALAYKFEKSCKFREQERDIILNLCDKILKNLNFNDLSIGTGFSGQIVGLNEAVKSLHDKTLHKKVNTIVDKYFNIIKENNNNYRDTSLALSIVGRSKLFNNYDVVNLSKKLLFQLDTKHMYILSGLEGGVAQLLLTSVNDGEKKLTEKYRELIIALSNEKDNTKVWPYPFEAIPTDFSFLSGTTGIYWALLKSIE